MRTLLTGALAALTLTGALSAQHYGTVASESFDYATGNLGGLAGGDGWFNAWWSGGNADDGLVTTPGHDAVGEKMTTNFENAGSFRIPASGPHPDIAPNFNFGSGDGVMWITFTSRRVAGGTDDYGGFSLNQQFVGEKLFIGSPFQTYEWGIADAVGGGVSTAAGSNIDQVTTIVVKITFTGAGETVELWVDPADAHPGGAPDASLAVADFEWNEVRLQSGVNNGGTTGYEFDGILIEKELSAIGMNYCGPAVANSSGNSAVITAYGTAVAANNDVLVEATGMALNQLGYFLLSQTQGFVNPPGSQGNLCLGGTIGRYNQNVLSTGASGSFSLKLDLGNIPVTPGLISPGETWNWQAWFRDKNPGNTSNLTDGVSVTFG